MLVDEFSYLRFVRRRKGLNEVDFLRQVRLPHLFLASPLSGLETAQVETEKVTDPDIDTSELGVAQIFPIAKRPGANAFPMMITLGRAPNNDIVLRDRRVSTFHAYFRLVGETWWICDVSSNGTAVDGTTLPRDEEAQIESNAVVTLARAVQVEFQLPPDLFDRVARTKLPRD